MADAIGTIAGTTATGAGGGGAATGGEGGGVATEIETGTGGAEGTPAEGGEEGTEGTGDGEGDGTGGEGGDEAAGDGEGEGGEGEGESDGSEFETDGRKIDDATKKALASLKKVDPAAAKRVAEAYFKKQGYEKVFPTIHEARGAKATLEAVGGTKGIQEMQTAVSDYDREIEQFGKGDPQLINQLWDSNPEGAELSAAAMIEVIGSKSAEAFDRVVIPAMVSRLEKAGFFASMNELAGHIKEGDGQAAYDLLAKIGKFFTDAKGLQKKQLELKSKVDPERTKFEKERSDFERQKTVEYENKIASNANVLNNKEMSKLVEPFFNKMKLPKDGRRRFVQGLQTEVWAAMKADNEFQMQARTIQKKGDAGETAEFVAGKFAELLPGIYRKYRNELYPNYERIKGKGTPAPKNGAGAATGGAAAGAGGGSGNIKLAPGARPEHSQVDWTKTPDVDWIRGKCVLVNGKPWTFDKNAPPNRI
jgi:hypothetical protein